MKRISLAATCLLLLSFLIANQAHSGPTGALEGLVVDIGNDKPLRGAIVSLAGERIQQRTDRTGKAVLTEVAPGRYTVECVANGYAKRTIKKVEVKAGKTVTFRCALKRKAIEQRETGKMAYESPSSNFAMMGISDEVSGTLARPAGSLSKRRTRHARVTKAKSMAMHSPPPRIAHNTENYAKIDDAPFRPALTEPLSTFSIDVDTAAYANARRFIERQNRLPVADAVRIEEFINYFDYAYPTPTGKHPFAVHTEISKAPWNPAHQLVHIGLQGEKVAVEDLPPSNLVFLIDVSGSMHQPQKLPLLKKSFQLMTANLRAQDRVAIVVYAGAAGLVLPSTPGSEKARIMGALESLRAGGSTAGGAGIQLAYETAREHFIKGGNNRVILATDGDFNVGASSTADLERMVSHEKESGVFLTILGFGRGNYKDHRMETLSNKGNGNAAYIDSLLEAKKVLVNEMGGTLLTIAKDVKIQVEFNPTKVKGYRLIGYENRALKNQDFNDDKKDAGELGAGHTVTVLYEIIPADSAEPLPGIDALKYQQRTVKKAASTDTELMTVKLRYKQPTGAKSRLIVHPVADRSLTLKNTSNAYRFAAAVASFGMLLRDSKLKGASSYTQVLELARDAMGKDENGYRAGFVQLVRKAEVIAQISGKIGSKLAR